MNPSEELSSAYELTPEQQSRYRNDGHLLLREVASEQWKHDLSQRGARHSSVVFMSVFQASPSDSLRWPLI